MSAKIVVFLIKNNRRLTHAKKIFSRPAAMKAL